MDPLLLKPDYMDTTTGGFSNVITGGNNNYATDNSSVWSIRGGVGPDDRRFFEAVNPPTLQVPFPPSHNNKEGETVIRMTISPTFWINLGYNNGAWDVGSPVAKKGYPTLIGVGGQ